MSPIFLGLIAISAGVILLAPRRWALLGLTGGVLYLPAVSELSVAGVAMYPARILAVAALARIILRREFPQNGLVRLDYALMLLYVYTVGVFLIRSNEGQVYQIGTAVDAFVTYFVGRAFFRSLDDLRFWLRGVAALLIPYVPLLWVETITHRNPFAAIGGTELSRSGDLWVRGGRLRAVGTFGHPSLLGTFGGTFLALFLGLWFSRKDRSIAILGTALCLGIVGAANSGGPVLCVAAALVGWSLWPLRRDMRWTRRGLLASIVVLAIVMKAPVWFILARVSAITGGDGYHRAALLDAGFQNLDRWWLAGMPLRETAVWLPYTNTTTGNVDMTNNFLQFGVTAGLGAVILLLAMLTVAYSGLGRSLGPARSMGAEGAVAERLYWALGVMLTVHIVNWFGITYWDQMNSVWFLQLGAIGTVAHLRLTKPESERRAIALSEHAAERDPAPRLVRSGPLPGLASDRPAASSSQGIYDGRPLF
jgi:hypothetical protein